MPLPERFVVINNVMLAGVSADKQHIKSFKSFMEIERNDGDGIYVQDSSRGDIARTLVCDRFLNDTRYDALLLCDLDQVFPKDTLIRLRSHDLDMVSGHYMKRTTKRTESIWQQSVVPCDWPYYSLVDPPLTGLHRLASSGMGCVLIKRHVIEDVAMMLPKGSSPFEIGKLPEVAILQGNFGSDYRFFYLAQKLGYELWGDAEVDCPHAITVWLRRNTAELMLEDRMNSINYQVKTMFSNSVKGKDMINGNTIMARIIQLNEIRKETSEERKLLVIDGQIAECEMWLEEYKKNANSPEDVEMWKNNYRYYGTPPKGHDITLPVFESEQEAEQAIATRDLAMGNIDEQEAAKVRSRIRQEEAAKAVGRMNGQNKDNKFQTLITSTNTGEMSELDAP